MLPARLRARFTVAGIGTAVPARVVTNHDFASYLDTSDEWIVSRTGIRERRISGPDESTGKLAVTAARRALHSAGLRVDEVDTIMVATTTPERPVPSTASGVAAALGSTAGAFDLNAACAGFVYGLNLAGGLLETGVSSSILLVGAETISRIIDFDDRSTAVLFGDGAAAVVLQGRSAARGARGGDADDSPEDQVGGLWASDLTIDPEASELLVVPAGGSAEPATKETVEAGRHTLQMDGSEVFRRAVRGVSDSITRTLEQARCSPDEVDLFVPHQANARIIEAVLPRVGLSAERTVQTVDHHGNTSSASIPLALAEAVEDGRLRNGHVVLVSGFGAGLTVGTSLLRWSSSAQQGRSQT